MSPSEDRPMAIDIDVHAVQAAASDLGHQEHVDSGPTWPEYVVTATGTVVAVLLVSSIAVLMYLA